MNPETEQRDREVVTMDPRYARTVATVARVVTILLPGVLAVALAAPGAGAHNDGTTSHLWLEHIKPLASPGTINATSNPVDWTKLKSVPDDWKDGTDDGVEYAGFGLIKWGTVFFVDWNKIQRRVKSTCYASVGMRSIDSKGAATCTAGPRVLTTTVASTDWMCDADCTEASLTLNAGTWSISATLDVQQAKSWIDELKVDCHLDAGGVSDTARVAMQSWGAANMSMQVVATLGRGGVTALVRCRDYNVGAGLGTGLTITAIRVD